MGMKLALELRPINVVASDYQGFKLFSFGRTLQEFRDVSKMPANFIFGMALRVAGIVTGITVAAAAP